jgi:hypothetical protein
MAQLYLPVAHTEADLVLAGLIAERMDSAELYVSWTPEHGRAAPELMAELRLGATHWTGSIALVIQAVRELWTALLHRAPRRPVVAPAPSATSAPREPAG